MFELADEIGREHVRLLRTLERAKSVQEITNTDDNSGTKRMLCIGDMKEGELTDRQRQGICVWANGRWIPYVQGDVLSKLEAVGFVTSERYQRVTESLRDGTERSFAWTCKVEVTVRGRDFMSRRCLCCLLSLLPSKANKWMVGFLALATIVGSGWSWVFNVAALAD